jgi:uncharacterized protein (TIGR03790 family)
MVTRQTIAGWAAGLLVAGAAAPAAALTPEDVVVLFNNRSPNSLRVARHYVAARKIPPNHLIAVGSPSTEVMTEEFYRTTFAPQLRKDLAAAKLLDGVKCLVTTYDVPLRIGPRQPAPAEVAEAQDDRRRLADTVAEMEQAVGAYDEILKARAAAPGTRPAAGEATWQAAVARLNAAASAAAARIEAAPPADRPRALQAFVRLQERVAGIAGVLNALRVSPDAPAEDEGRRQLNALSEQLRSVEGQFQVFQTEMDKPAARKQLIALRGQAQGLVGQARQLEATIAYLTAEETEACLDSELALLLADPHYPRSRWLLNPKNIETFNGQVRTAADPPTLLVARLDGASPAAVEGMIDATLAVEAKGLDGTFYLDARGLRGTDAYALFDADLRRTADWTRQHASIPVVLDDTAALLQAKDAPNAALYCGWYSLRSYAASGQWVKGAVGYHVASLEMVSLHTPQEPGWVVNLLTAGFCGTLGATDEPYLTAFPKPSLFFPLLLSGEFSQGEVWQVTTPLLSWRIGFVGDPLYTPFKVNPRVKVDDLRTHTVLRNAWPLLRGAAAPPAPPAGGR